MPSYPFDSFLLDVDSRELLKDGQPVAVELKVFDLILYLIENRSRAVGKDELQEQIWKDVIVTEASLSRCVMKARRALDDEDRPHRYIHTVHGFGFRFVGDLSADQDSPGPPDAPALPSRPSIAVLPLRNLSDQEQDWFCEGMAEDIITELSRFRSLFVIAAHSSFALARENLTVREIGRRLGVAYALEGSIQRDAERLRMNLRLIETAHEKQIWGHRYDREMGDVFLLQDELARTIAATIGGRVEATRARRHLDPEPLAAYDLVLRAQALYYQVTPVSVREAIPLLERAVRLDPASARGFALLAACHSIESWSYWSPDPDESQRLSLEFGRRSLELDDTDSLAHALFGEILLDNDQAELAETHFQRAIELNPNDIAGHALYASLLAATGRGEEGLQHIAIAERLDPYGLIWVPWVKLTVEFSAGHYAECIATSKRMDRLPNEGNLWVAAALMMLNEEHDAIVSLSEFLRRARQEMPSFPGWRFEDWDAVFQRYLGIKHAADHERVAACVARIWDRAAAAAGQD